MSRQALTPGQFVVIAGGTRELLERLASAESGDVMRAHAIAVYEPDMAGSPWYVLPGRRLAELVDLIDRGEVEPVAGWLADRLGLAPVALLHDKDQPGAPAILVVDGEPAAVFLPAERTETRDIGFAPVDQRWIAGSDPLPPFAESPVASGADAAAESFIRRTPHLDAPEQLPPARTQTFTVKVWTDSAPASAFEEAQDLLVEAPPDVEQITVTVLLSATRHFDVGDDFAQPLTIERAKADSEPCAFTVKLVDPEAEGDAGITARLQYRGRPCGRVRRVWSWPDGMPRTLGATAATVSVHTEAAPPDMSVLITAEVNDGINFTCSVRAPSLPGREEFSKPEPWALREAAPAMIARWLDRFVDRTQLAEKRRAALRQAGRTFWKSAPRIFKTVLLELISAREEAGEAALATIYITSDEPVLPWELMLPALPQLGGGERDRAAPLGVEFAVGRWLRGDATSPPQLLPVTDSVFIAPTYDAPDRQLDPAVELDTLRTHFDIDQPKSASYSALDQYFAEHDASLIHFVCHGQNLADSEVLLLDRDEQCTAADVRDSTGFARACSTRKPLVFINACDAGQHNIALGAGGSGFPMAFSELGARAVIAPLWPVSKLNAPKVAKELYERAFAAKDTPLAAIVAELRERAFTEPEFDDSWAAYCFFGDPCARLAGG